MGGRPRREGPYVCLWLSHVDEWQKRTQSCKAIILQLKIYKFIERKEKTSKRTRVKQFEESGRIFSIFSEKQHWLEWRGKVWPRRILSSIRDGNHCLTLIF